GHLALLPGGAAGRRGGPKAVAGAAAAPLRRGGPVPRAVPEPDGAGALRPPRPGPADAGRRPRRADGDARGRAGPGHREGGRRGAGAAPAYSALPVGEAAGAARRRPGRAGPPAAAPARARPAQTRVGLGTPVLSCLCKVEVGWGNWRVASQEPWAKV